MSLDTGDLLKPLRGMYLAQLRERVESVASFIEQCRAGAAQDNEKQVMKALAHKLAGSGTTYGFPLITQTARALEEALDDASTPDSRLLALAESLQHVCDQVLLSVERGAEGSLTGIQPAQEDTRPVLLSVDDDPVVRDTIAAVFQRDFNVVSAHEGAAALELARKHKPHLVLLDENMPGLSGTEVLQALRADEGLRGIPVIMLTAQSHARDVARAVAAGAVDYLVKPFDPGQLADKVRELMHRSGKSVLIADDDAAIRDLLAYKFRLAGLRVLTAADGEEALRQAQLHRPDLAILDRMMPGLDGVTVLQQLRASPETRRIPVIFLTAMRQERDILEGFRLGVADYVIKPFLPEEVLARGMRLLGLGATA
ncbi:MAG: two-component response regulator [Fibrobacteria bacterium]|jgi:DNA-binding response OmpR family regulator/HPt (histidine-containing phosphotransfer) domain-containing protein|nr:two-component response regulator [Fibrobacteria bacterium]